MSFSDPLICQSVLKEPRPIHFEDTSLILYIPRKSLLYSIRIRGETQETQGSEWWPGPLDPLGPSLCGAYPHVPSSGQDLSQEDLVWHSMSKRGASQDPLDRNNTPGQILGTKKCISRIWDLDNTREQVQRSENAF